MRAFNSLSRALSAVSQVWGRTGLKTRFIISDILSALYENHKIIKHCGLIVDSFIAWNKKYPDCSGRYNLA